jgi:hypothetical protein
MSGGCRTWSYQARKSRSDAPAPTSFLTGLRSDQDAVTAGLTLAWSSGARARPAHPGKERLLLSGADLLTNCYQIALPADRWHTE